MILYQSKCKEIDVAQFCNCDIRITDKYEQYCDRNIKYRDAVTLDILIYNNSKNPKIIATAFTDHRIGWLNEVKIPIGTDGWYTVYHIIIPTITWFQNNSSKLLSKYNSIYVTDGKNVYKIIDNQLVQFNPNSLIKLNLDNSNLILFKKEIFLTCHLQKCLLKHEIEYVNALFDRVDSKTIKFYKDFLWCSLEVLKLLITKCRLKDAELLIEEIMSCGGLCYTTQSSLQYNTISSDNSYIKYLDGNCNCNN